MTELTRCAEYHNGLSYFDSNDTKPQTPTLAGFDSAANDADTLAIIPRRSLPRISGARDDSPHTVVLCH